ncbi:hypothetical protein BE15_44460 [Sorangium cellulosum]|uniref:Uncharacterized protein n=1 Tax=Sorangium cellulosum TaxID=56 RepID=A0A150Q553_SORCE|nr:hypothetical protein BE15_44460 [Sorangium cellulosum]
MSWRVLPLHELVDVVRDPRERRRLDRPLLGLELLDLLAGRRPAPSFIVRVMVGRACTMPG